MKKQETLHYIKSNNNDYALLDSGAGRKLERFGSFTVARPFSQAIWEPQLPESVWENADAIFMREGDKKWIKQPSNEFWTVDVSGVTFKISTTDFGHLGIFPEQRDFWHWIQRTIEVEQTKRSQPLEVLNLFAYSGGSTLAAAKAGANVCHLDASKGMVSWARENATLNQLDNAPIRWIVDDVNKFLARELRRNKRYDAIILDPPSFGRGSQGEVFKIEEHLPIILSNCRALLSDNPLFMLLSCHTPGYTPTTLHHLLAQTMQKLGGQVDHGEMLLKGEAGVLPVPSGTYARWYHG